MRGSLSGPDRLGDGITAVRTTGATGSCAGANAGAVSGFVECCTEERLDSEKRNFEGLLLWFAEDWFSSAVSLPGGAPHGSSACALGFLEPPAKYSGGAVFLLDPKYDLRSGPPPEEELEVRLRLSRGEWMTVCVVAPKNAIPSESLGEKRGTASDSTGSAGASAEAIGVSDFTGIGGGGVGLRDDGDKGDGLSLRRPFFHFRNALRMPLLPLSFEASGVVFSACAIVVDACAARHKAVWVN